MALQLLEIHRYITFMLCSIGLLDVQYMFTFCKYVVFIVFRTFQVFWFMIL